MSPTESSERALVEASPEAMFVVDAKGFYVDWNPAALEMVGVDAEKLRSLNIGDLLPPEERATALEDFQLLATVGHLEREYRLLRSSGERVWVRLRAVKLSDGRFIAICQDIDARVKAADAEETHRRYLRTILDTALDGFWVVDRDGNLVDVNPAYCAMTGFSREELLRMRIADLDAEETPSETAARIDRIVESGFDRFETSHRRKDGSHVRVSAAVRLVAQGSGMMVCFFQDITERKRAEAEAQEREFQLRAYFETPAVGISITGPDKKWVHVNDALCDMLGYSREELTGMTWLQLTHPDDLPATVAAFDRLRAGELDRYTLDKRYVRKDGSLLWALLSVSCTRKPDGGIDYLVSILQDIGVRKQAEEALARSEALFRGLFEDHAAVKLVIDPVTGSIIDANRAAASYYGWSKERLAQMRVQDLNTLSPAETVREMERARFQHRSHFEFRHRRADGSVRDVAVFSSQIEIKGKPLLHSIIHDVTDQKRAEEALQKARRTLLMITRCDEAILRASTEEQLFADVCRVIVETGGYRMCWVGVAENDQRRSIRPVAHAGHEDGYLGVADVVWADAPGGRGPTGTAVREGKVVVGQDFLAEDALTPWRDEALRRGYRSSTALPLAYESERVGALTMYSGDVTTFTDEELRLLRQLADDVAFGAHALRQRAARARAIAGREAAIQALSSEQGRFRGLIEGSRDLTLIIDRDGAIQFASPASTEIMGLDPADLTGKPVLGYVHAEDRPKARKAMAEVLASPSAASRVEVRIRRADGSFALVESGLRNLLGVSGVDGIVINNRDITERNRLREQFQQAQKLESIGRLAGGVAHDFNNLLTVILSCTEIMRGARQAGREVDDEDISDIHEAGERARDLTRQLLAFARKQIIAPVSLDLNDVVRGAEKLLPRLLGEDIRLQVKLASDLWPTLCDASQVEQVLVNLAVNARDAMPGGGTLEIESRNVGLDDDDGVRLAERRPGEWVRVIVRDTGSGIPPDAMAHLFEPFFTTKGLGKGTGLGLATVHGIVAQSGGHIHVDSELGRGTTFQICFPRTVQPQAPRPTARGPASPGGSETVLVVEDDQRVRSLTVRALEERGYAVLAAGGGEEAASLARGRAGAIDLVVADVVMPGKNGRELVEELRLGRPGLRALFVSGYTHDAIAQRGVLDSGVEFLAKPFTPTTLAARVRELLDRR